MNPRLLICDHESQQFAEVMLVVGDKYFPLGTTQSAQGYSKEYAMEGMTVREEIPLGNGRLGPAELTTGRKVIVIGDASFTGEVIDEVDEQGVVEIYSTGGNIYRMATSGNLFFDDTEREQ